MFSLKNRGKLERWVQDEFEHLFARLRGFLSVSHNDDGTLVGIDLSLANLIPIATISQYGGTSAPTGWLLCDGSQVSRVTYKSLFEVVGTTYGAGDGSTTFHLPDMRQRFPLGKAAAGTGAALGATGGAIDHVHTGPSHTHSISASGDHTHSINDHSHSLTSDGSHVHAMSALQSHATGTSSGIDVQSGSGARAAPEGHAHFADAPGSSVPDTDSGGSHDHGGATDTTSISANAGGDHSHGGATGASGTGNTGTANPPFLSLNFIIFAGA